MKYPVAMILIVFCVSKIDVIHIPGEGGEAVYHSSPDHIWNRLFTHLYTRSGPGGVVYGPDVLDPLLWQETGYLLTGPAYDQALVLMDEFIATHAGTEIADPARRAVFQRDLWAVFDWLSLRAADSTTDQSRIDALQTRLVQIMRQLALSPSQVKTLPDNYAAAVNSNTFPAVFQPDQPQTPYLPAELLVDTGSWVNVKREGGPTALTHVEDPAFSGRSVFLVFLRVDTNREATLEYIRQLSRTEQASEAPPFPDGTQLALVRQMLHLSSEGVIVPIAITESVQLRYFEWGGGQHFYEFLLDRTQLFAGETGGLHAVAVDEAGYPMFRAHTVDHFDYGDGIEPLVILDFCSACHAGVATNSFLSYSRRNFALPDSTLPTLIASTASQEARDVIAWKTEQANWQTLHRLWTQTG